MRKRYKCNEIRLKSRHSCIIYVLGSPIFFFDEAMSLKNEWQQHKAKHPMREKRQEEKNCRRNDKKWKQWKKTHDGRRKLQHSNNSVQ